MNSMKVIPKIVFFSLLQLLLCILCFFNGNISFGVIISLIQLGTSILTIYFVNNRLLTFGVVFLVLSYVLHMGNLLTTQLLGSNNEFLYSLDNSTIIKGINFFILCHFMFTLGLCMGANKSHKTKLNKKLGINKKAFWKMGVFCTFIGVVPRIYLDYRQLQSQLVNGYLGSLDEVGGNNRILSILGQFFYVGILSLIFLSDDNKWRARFITVLVSVWEVITMLSGGRIYAVSIIIAMIYIYIAKVEKPNWKQVAIGAIVLYFVCSLLSAIALVRKNGVFSIADIQKYIFYSLGKNNPIVSMLDELGGTFMSLGLAIDNIPSYHAYGYGKTYISTILSVIPTYESNIADMNDLIYIYSFRNSAYLGGSWIGEAYYNFSWFGCLYCMVWGGFMGRFENIMKIEKRDDKYFGSLFIVTFVFYIVTYARDYFYRFTTAIQVFMVVTVLACVLKNFTLKITNR